MEKAGFRQGFSKTRKRGKSNPGKFQKIAGTQIENLRVPEQSKILGRGTFGAVLVKGEVIPQKFLGLRP